MNKRVIVFFLFAAMITAVGSAQSLWGNHTRAGEWAFAHSDFERAEIEFQAALEIAQGFPPGDQRLESSLENLARFYEHQSKFDQAQPLFQLLVVAQQTRLGENNPILLDGLMAIARVGLRSGDVPTARESLERFASIAEESGKANPSQWWQGLAMLARMDTLREEDELALGWQRRAAEVLADDPNADDSERADVLESLAQMELVAGDSRRAEVLLVQVAELRTTEDKADATADTMAHGARAAFGAGELETAERLAKRSLNAHPNATAELTSRQVLADVSWLQVRRGSENLGDLLAAAEDNTELVRARDRLRSILAMETGENLETLTRLVQVEALRGHPQEAADWQRQVVAKTENHGATTAEVLSRRRDLVTLLVAAGEKNDALIENALVISAMEQSYGARDPHLREPLQIQLDLLTETGRKKEARAIKKRLKKL